MHTNKKLYEHTKQKSRRAKQIERDCSGKNQHSKSGSKHQKNKMLAELRRNEVICDV